MPGDTYVTAYPTSTQRYVVVTFDMGSGSGFETSTANAWQAGDFRRVAGSVRLNANSGAVWQMRRPQLERGSTATPFEFQQYATILDQCMRRYRKIGIGYTEGAIVDTALSTATLLVNLRFSPPMLATPAITVSLAGVSNTVRSTAVGAIISATPTASGAYLAPDGMNYLQFSGTPFTAGAYYDFDLTIDSTP